jgi:hypothetical protein
MSARFVPLGRPPGQWRAIEGILNDHLSPGYASLLLDLGSCARSSLILDIGDRALSSTILVAGIGRSGTTWLAQVLSALTRSRMIFEPFILDEQNEFAILKQRRFNRHWLDTIRNLYIDPTAGVASPYFRAIERILCGKVINTWVNQYTPVGIYWRRVIKAIRGNVLLPYITQTWPNLKIVWVIRDPVNVVASQVVMARRYGWQFDRVYEIVGDNGYIDPWLVNSLAAKRPAKTLVEKMAHRWCIDTMFPYHKGVHRRQNVRMVSYNALVSDRRMWSDIAQFIGIDYSDERHFGEMLAIPSCTARSQILNVCDERLPLDYLSHTEIKSIERIVDDYGAYVLPCF